MMPVFLCAGRVAAQSWSVRVTSGYERENFSWSIAGNSAGLDPNVLSELKWRNVGGVSGGVDLEGRVWGRWRMFVSGMRVWTRWGSMTDADYGLDNRNDRLYFLRLPVTGGYSEAVDAGVGYAVLERKNWRVAVYGGYGWDGQDFDINGVGYAQLNSRYDARWMGPMGRGVVSWTPAQRWEVTADVSYHQLVYRASADWNLIPEFSHPVSFRHHADGYGVKGELEVGYGIGKKKLRAPCGMGEGPHGMGEGIKIFGAVDWFDAETGTGIDALYLQSGEQQQTQLNSVRRDGWGLRVGVEWRL